MTFIYTFHCKQNFEIGRHVQSSWTSLRSVYWVSYNVKFPCWCDRQVMNVVWFRRNFPCCVTVTVSIGVHKLTGACWFLSQLQSLILQKVADCSHDSLIYLDFIISRWMCENPGTTRSRHTFLCFPNKPSLNFQTPVLFLYMSCLMKATTI